MAWHKPASVKDWLGIIGRHKKKFFFPAVLGAIAVIYCCNQFMPRQYTAEAKFQRLYDPAMQQMGGTQATQIMNSIRAVMMEEITGRPAIEQLLEDVELTKGLPRTPPTPDSPAGELTTEGQLARYDLVNKIRTGLRVYFQTQTGDRDQIVIGYTSQDPTQAPKLVNQVMENYIRKVRSDLDAALTQSKEFYEKQKDIYQRKLADLEQKKMQFEMDNPGLAPNDPGSTRTKLVETRARLSTHNDDLEKARSDKTGLEEAIKAMPKEIETRRQLDNPQAVAALDRKAKLEAGLQELLAGGRTEEHPLVKKLRQQIKEAEKEIAKIAPTKEDKEYAPNPQIFAADMELKRAISKIEGLEKAKKEIEAQVDQYEAMDRNFFVVRSEYVRMTRELDDAAQQFSFYDAKLKSTMTAMSVEMMQKGVRLSILQKAMGDVRPSKPTWYFIFGVAAMVATSLGALLVLASEFLDHSFHTVEQAVDGLKLPVLGAVNEIITPAAAFRRRIYGLGIYPAMGLVTLMVLAAAMMLTYLELDKPTQYQNVMRQYNYYRQQLPF